MSHIIRTLQERTSDKGPLFPCICPLTNFRKVQKSSEKAAANVIVHLLGQAFRNPLKGLLKLNCRIPWPRKRMAHIVLPIGLIVYTKFLYETIICDSSHGFFRLTRTEQTCDSLRPVLLRSVLLTQPRGTPLRILPCPNPPLLRHFLSSRRWRSTVQRFLVLGTSGPCLWQSDNESLAFEDQARPSVRITALQ
jgi:hypothetical protein